MKFLKRYVSNIPLLALVVANAVPLWGVLFLGWDAFYIVLLYWAENIAVGFYGILKIALDKAPNLTAHLGRLLFIPFLAFHYGAFMGVHGFFILVLFKKSDGQFIQGNEWPCFLVFIQLLVNVIKEAYALMPANMKYALAALFVSHGISFIYNYLLKKGFASIASRPLMAEPYVRLVVMHITIIAGGIFATAIGEPTVILLGLVFLKIVLEVKLYLREHRKKQKSKSAKQT